MSNYIPFIPEQVFFTRGVGRDKEQLKSFEDALRVAGIAPFNLVHVSSILPPHAKIISAEEGTELLKGMEGMILFCVKSRTQTDEHHRLIAASVGCAIPKDRNHYGYLSEHESFGETDEVAGERAEDMAFEMLAETLGVKIDPEKSYDEHKKEWHLHREEHGQPGKIRDYIVDSINITQSATGQKGLWTTVFSAAVLLPSREQLEALKQHRAEKFGMKTTDPSRE